MTEHTPGPWRWWTSCSFRRLSSDATGKDGDVLYATTQPSDGHPDIMLPNGGYDGPDGRLIAAAPDLLAALQALFGADMAHVLMGDGKDDQIEAIAMARAAVAKATGGRA